MMKPEKDKKKHKEGRNRNESRAEADLGDVPQAPTPSDFELPPASVQDVPSAIQEPAASDPMQSIRSAYEQYPSTTGLIGGDLTPASWGAGGEIAAETADQLSKLQDEHQRDTAAKADAAMNSTRRVKSLLASMSTEEKEMEGERKEERRELAGETNVQLRQRLAVAEESKSAPGKNLQDANLALGAQRVDAQNKYLHQKKNVSNDAHDRARAAARARDNAESSARSDRLRTEQNAAYRKSNAEIERWQQEETERKRKENATLAAGRKTQYAQRREESEAKKTSKIAGYKEFLSRNLDPEVKLTEEELNRVSRLLAELERITEEEGREESCLREVVTQLENRNERKAAESLTEKIARTCLNASEKILFGDTEGNKSRAERDALNEKVKNLLREASATLRGINDVRTGHQLTPVPDRPQGAGALGRTLGDLTTAQGWKRTASVTGREAGPAAELPKKTVNEFGKHKKDRKPSPARNTPQQSHDDWKPPTATRRLENPAFTPTMAAPYPENAPGGIKIDYSGAKKKAGAPSVEMERGAIFTSLSEEHVRRGSDGLIEAVDGTPLDQYLRGLAQERSSGIPKTQICYAITADRRTGTLAEAVNGSNASKVIPTERLHPRLQENYANMAAYEHEIRPASGKGEADKLEGRAWPDAPLRHAEVKSTNELLWAREKAGIRTADLGEFAIFPVNLTKGSADFPACPNCSNILRGVKPCTGLHWYAPMDERRESSPVDTARW
ncbi:YwqJ-related putative deaminase [Streptomyces yunnanensis]|nr:YwqJ-related putative deaminase [Streptomyces yunnanensis]